MYLVSEYITISPIWLLLIVLFLFPLYFFLLDFYIWFHLPPGPLPVPFAGNKFQIPTSKYWLTFTQWSRVYGPIYTIWMARTPILIISDPEIAADLLINRSAKYSSRPRAIVFSEIYSQQSSIVMLPYGPAWSIRRKLLHHALKGRSLAAFQPVQEAEASKLVSQMLHQPETWSSSIERYTATLVFSMAYGRRIDTLKSKILQTRKQLMEVAHAILAPGAYLADSFPILASLPDFLAPWKKEVRDSGNEHTEFNIRLVDVVRSDLRKSRGEGVGSMTETMLRLKEQRMLGHQLSQDRYLSSVPATLFGAGADTVSSTLHSTVLALLTHPHILSIARQEIDSVVGTDRSPTFEDHLPYCDALVKEVLRWRPVAPLVLPHATTEADTYQSWKIPQGTIIIVNTYAVNKHPDYFPRPEEFAPERFLDERDPRYRPELKGREFPGRFGHGSFGWGRRACAGADLALASTRSAVVKIVWACEIVGLEGEVYDVDAFEGGIVLKPRDFKCGFKFRSEEHKVVMERGLEDAGRVLEKFLPFE
ncbi:cytochrome P450 [Mollisia scopiformis]|uniref:Cytochrome P450 n=1 Tax=Mollisia scopiformis TaxID=149040 RepID=A0A194XJQ7_MOLSC|nr:cytochrome P450 [Mollisia scopiformis]KUJ20349.1 cytochrome P450 [Mollisia scopiformis]